MKQVAAAYHTDNTISHGQPGELARGGDIQYLPATKTEVEKIKQQADKAHLQVDTLTGIHATEESFKALNGKASPSVLHIATHGFFFPDPNGTDSIQTKFQTTGKAFRQAHDPLFRSGLLFAGANNAWRGKPVSGIEDGIVTAYDVSGMYLPHTKLVVLSACETALGDIQGSEAVYGLQRTFKIAGAQNLVMSLWKVPDAETSEFMQLFYDNMFAHQSVSNAFYHAQTMMKNKYRSEPVKWAAWILVQ
jgi:CHAT domain-containing protein